MILRQLAINTRFIFEDVATPVTIRGPRMTTFPARGVFKYLSVKEDGCPELLHIMTGTRFVAVSGTYDRYVTIIF